VQAPDATSANGLTETPDREALLVVNSSNGTLYRVDKDSGAATAVDLDGCQLSNGDGLLRERRTLFAVRNRVNTVAVLRLSRDGTCGELRAELTSPDFDVPTTVARFGKALYLPNARSPTPTRSRRPTGGPDWSRESPHPARMRRRAAAGW